MIEIRQVLDGERKGPRVYSGSDLSEALRQMDKARAAFPKSRFGMFVNGTEGIPLSESQKHILVNPAVLQPSAKNVIKAEQVERTLNVRKELRKEQERQLREQIAKGRKKP